MKVETFSIILPAHWSSYLMYGEDSTLTKDDIFWINDFLSRYPNISRNALNVDESYYSAYDAEYPPYFTRDVAKFHFSLRK